MGVALPANRPAAVRSGAAWQSSWPIAEALQQSAAPADAGGDATAFDRSVLILVHEGAMAPQVTDQGVQLRSEAGVGYRLRLRHAGNLAQIGEALAAVRPEVVVIDAHLIETIGSSTVRHLLERSVRWLIGWSTPSQRWAELVLQLELRGCLDWRQSTAEMARTFDAVMAGELWFPRWVMQWLYLSALNAARLEAAPAFQFQTTASTSPLTEREAQVLLLMRDGLTNKEIGARLGISANTVKKHLTHAFDKRGLHHRRQGLF